MVKYMCPRCGYKTHRKSNINYHINKSNLCDSKLSKVIPDVNNIICENKTREELITEVEMLRMELEKALSKITTIENQTNIANIENQNIIENQTINVVVLPHGNPNLEHLTDKDFKHCIGRMIMSVPTLIRKVHFNPNHPENHNIYISNIKDSHAMTFDGSQWNLCDRKQLIEDLIDDYEYKLEEWLQNGDREHPVEMKMFREYLEKKDADGVVDRIKQEIKYMLYNNRNMVNTQ